MRLATFFLVSQCYGGNRKDNFKPSCNVDDLILPEFAESWSCKSNKNGSVAINDKCFLECQDGFYAASGKKSSHLKK